MRIFFAAVPNLKIFHLLKHKKARNFLQSFASPKQLLTLAPNLSEDDRIIVDSGAFSSWASGQKIDLVKYIEYCKKTKPILPVDTVFVNLDVIPGKFGTKPTKNDIEFSAEQGWKNYETMRNSGVNTMHIFHQHEDFKWLTRIANDSEYFGVSPANDLSLKERMLWLNQVFKRIKATRKTHAFGLTAFQALKTYPFFSADSSTWLTSSMYGTTNYYKDFKKATKSYKDKKEALEMGMDSRHMNDYVQRLEIGIDSVIRMEKDVTRLWERRGIFWN